MVTKEVNCMHEQHSCVNLFKITASVIWIRESKYVVTVYNKTNFKNAETYLKADNLDKIW